jgi:cytochrome P450
VSRRAVEDDEITGCPIPSGSVVAVSPYAMHRSPRYWDTPEVFEPERFAPGAAATRPAATYIPFGAGPHRCIGESLAMMEGVLILAMVARRCRLELVEADEIAPKPGWVLPPSTPVMMRAEFRPLPA